MRCGPLQVDGGERGRRGRHDAPDEADGGEVVREDQVAAGSSEWTGEYDLAAGDYVLSVVENPAMLYYVTAQ